MKMNLQLFGYDDGFYYGQCKLICETETVAGNGKTVTISGNGRTWSGTIADKLCSFLVPGRGQYTISLMNGGTTEWSGVVEVGYGECIHVMLADGYEAVMEKSKLTLAEIEASVGSVADYVPDADCVKTLNNNLTANSKAFIFDYHDGKYGYNTNPNRGADTFIPFSNISPTLIGTYDITYGDVPINAEIGKYYAITYFAVSDYDGGTVGITGVDILANTLIKDHNYGKYLYAFSFIVKATATSIIVQRTGDINGYKYYSAFKLG